jgi:hypothetical protein
MRMTPPQPLLSFSGASRRYARRASAGCPTASAALPYQHQFHDPCGAISV